jgi:hypothetical protein
VLWAEDPHAHRQQLGEQVPGGGRIPRHPGPAGEVVAGGMTGTGRAPNASSSSRAVCRERSSACIFLRNAMLDADDLSVSTTCFEM